MLKEKIVTRESPRIIHIKSESYIDRTFHWKLKIVQTILKKEISWTFFKGVKYPTTKYIAIVIHTELVKNLSTSIPTSIESPYVDNNACILGLAFLYPPQKCGGI